MTFITLRVNPRDLNSESLRNHSPFLACVCVSFWISCEFFRHYSVVHLCFALLSIARRESPGWDWLRAPLIRVGMIYPPAYRIYRPISWTILVLFLPVVRVSWARFHSVLLLSENRGEESDRELEIIYKNFLRFVELREYPFAIKSL